MVSSGLHVVEELKFSIYKRFSSNLKNKSLSLSSLREVKYPNEISENIQKREERINNKNFVRCRTHYPTGNLRDAASSNSEKD